MVVKYSRMRSTVYHIAAIVIGFIMIYPLLWMVMSSFKDKNDIFSTAYSLVPQTWHIAENYRNGWAGIGGISFGVFLKNSIIVTLIGTIGNIISSLMAAAAFSRVKFKWSGFWFSCVMLTMMIPAQVMVVPHNFQKTAFNRYYCIYDSTLVFWWGILYFHDGTIFQRNS